MSLFFTVIEKKNRSKLIQIRKDKKIKFKGIEFIKKRSKSVIMISLLYE